MPELLAPCSWKTRTKVSPMARRLASGSMSPASASRKVSEASTKCVLSLEAEVGEDPEHLGALVLAHQAVVDVQQVQPVGAERATEQRRGDRGVDAAGREQEDGAAPRPAAGSCSISSSR